MSGSFDMILKEDGEFTMDLIGNMGDAYEALEECFEVIKYLSGGNLEKIREALVWHYACSNKKYGHEYDTKSSIERYARNDEQENRFISKEGLDIVFDKPQSDCDVLYNGPQKYYYYTYSYRPAISVPSLTRSAVLRSINGDIQHPIQNIVQMGKDYQLISYREINKREYIILYYYLNDMKMPSFEDE